MRNRVIALILAVLVFCSTANAALVNNPDSFERGDTILQIFPNPTNVVLEKHFKYPSGFKNGFHA